MSSIDRQSSSISLNAIGKVIAREEEGRFELHIDPPFRPALTGLGEFSHVMVLWWIDRHDNPESRKIIKVNLPYARGTTAGVFACRSERRPNPIGITIMPMLDINLEDGIIRLPWIDALDGSPILDLKPYLPVSDRVRDVKVADWMSDWPEWMEDAGEYFATHSTDFGC